MRVRKRVARCGKWMALMGVLICALMAGSVAMAAVGYYECDMKVISAPCPPSCSVTFQCPVGSRTCNVTTPGPALGRCVTALYFCDIGTCPGTCIGYPNESCYCWGSTMSCDN